MEQEILSAALGLLVLLIGFLATRVSGFISLSKQHQALKALELVVVTVVRDIAQSAVNKLKDASSDGKLSPDAASAALHTAIQEIRARLPKGILSVLLGMFSGDESLLFEHLKSAVNAQVFADKPINISRNISQPDPITLESAKERIGI
jgi:hypothetical protein